MTPEVAVWCHYDRQPILRGFELRDDRCNDISACAMRQSEHGYSSTCRACPYVRLVAAE